MFKRGSSVFEGVLAAGIFCFVCVAAVLFAQAADGAEKAAAKIDFAAETAMNAAREYASDERGSERAYYDAAFTPVESPDGAAFELYFSFSARAVGAATVVTFERYLGDDEINPAHSTMAMFEPFSVSVRDLSSGEDILTYNSARYY